MSKIYARRSALIEYKQHLLAEKQNLINQSEQIKKVLASLHWSDTIREDIVKGLNNNFSQFNKIISGINEACKQIDQLIEQLDNYFRSTGHIY